MLDGEVVAIKSVPVAFLILYILECVQFRRAVEQLARLGDDSLHLREYHILVDGMRIVITAGQIYSGTAEVWRENGNIGKRAPIGFEVLPCYEALEVGIITVIEHGVIRAFTIELNNEMESERFGELGLREFLRANGSRLLILTEEHGTVVFFQHFKKDINARSVVSADSLRA